MTPYERAIIEAAFDLFKMQSALDCGVPAGAMQRKAYNRLLDACNELAAENDGRLCIQTPRPEISVRTGIRKVCL